MCLVISCVGVIPVPIINPVTLKSDWHLISPYHITPAFYQDYLTACHDQFIKQIPGEEKHFERNAFCSRTQHNILQEFKPRSFNPKSSPLATRAPHLRQQCHKHSDKLLNSNIMVYPFACHYSSTMILPCV